MLLHVTVMDGSVFSTIVYAGNFSMSNDQLLFSKVVCSHVLDHLADISEAIVHAQSFIS